MLSSQYINQLTEFQKAINIANSSGIQEALNVANNPVIQQIYQSASTVQSMTTSIQAISDQLSILSMTSNCLSGLLSENVLELYQSIYDNVQFLNPIHDYENLITSFQQLDGILSNYNLLNFYSDDLSNMEFTENEEINNKVITEIFQPDSEKTIDNEESPIITLSPVNDQVLKYLSEHPESFYQLTDNDFEVVMAEIYSKLGYDVTRTKATRDGGKDLIIRIPEILGDFIYYVECKKYAAKRPIGVGIIRNLVGTVNTDRVNGGILATTSFFTRDAYDFISENKWNCQIKTHDYNVIKDLISMVVISS